MAGLSSQQKNQALQAMADALVDQKTDILEANQRDLDAIPKEGDKQVYRKAVERIRLDEEVIQQMVERLLDF